MTHIALKEYGPPMVFPKQIRSGNPRAKKLLHIGVHNSANRNAGDTLLFPVVRKVFDENLGPFDWELRQAWEPFTAPDAQIANESFDGIVIGGGGLLLRDQTGSDVAKSGWQWNSSIDAVKAIGIPLIIYGIGYNRFRGQSDFDPIFKDHIGAVVEKSTFFGLRNYGSIAAVRDYVNVDAGNKLHHQFCPTTVLWQLYPKYRALAEAHDLKKKKILAFNAAFDRASLRFGDNPDEILQKVANSLLVAQARDWDIVVTAHKTMDRDIERYLDRAGISYRTVDLTDASPQEIIEFYAEIDLAYGMRGHAQMIPLGLRRPILSIISHNKMRYLLDDINKPEWGIEVNAADLSERLQEYILTIELERARIKSEIASVQQRIWQETEANMDLIGYALGIFEAKTMHGLLHSDLAFS
jgi:polysaccharide pyruvyl transferase WcaK-like protein